MWESYFLQIFRSNQVENGLLHLKNGGIFPAGLIIQKRYTSTDLFINIEALNTAKLLLNPNKKEFYISSKSI